MPPLLLSATLSSSALKASDWVRNISTRSCCVYARSATVGVLAMLLILAGCSTRLPERYTIAATSVSTPSVIHTYVSPDGVQWSGRGAGSATLAVMPGVPAGLGSSNDMFMLAWFAPGGVLTTATSTDGLNWVGATTHGMFPVDLQSRPAVAFDFRNDTWFVAFRRSDGMFVVVRVMPAGGAAVTVPGLAPSTSAPALTWVNDTFVLGFPDAMNRVRILRSADGVTWPANGGAIATNAAGAPIVAADAASLFLTNSLGTLYMTVKGLPQGPTLHRGAVRVFSSADALTWTLERSLVPTSPSSRGAAVTGPRSEQVVVDSAPSQTTEVWFNDTQVRAFQTGTTDYEVTAAHGPAAPGTLRQVEITFNQFKRLGGPFGIGDDEDVTLSAEHFDVAGVRVHAIPPRTVDNAVKNQSHFWNQTSGGALPKLAVLMQAGETIVITVDGDDNPVSRTLTLGEITAACPTDRHELVADQPASADPYQLFISCQVR
jgi:hypothetical protein